MKLNPFKHRFIEESDCQKSHTKEQTKYFYITWLNCTDLNILRKDTHFYTSKRTLNTKEYVLNYVCFKTDTTECGIVYTQAYLQFTKKITPSTVYKLFNGCRVVKADSYTKKDFLYFTNRGLFEQYGKKVKQRDTSHIIKSKNVLILDEDLYTIKNDY
jgi:hypothetical protein